MKEQDKILSAISKLIELTQTRVITWQREPNHTYLHRLSVESFPIAYLAEYKGTPLALYHTIYEGELAIKLAILDDARCAPLWYFPYGGMLEDLKSAVIRSIYDPGPFLDQLVEHSTM